MISGFVNACRYNLSEALRLDNLNLDIDVFCAIKTHILTAIEQTIGSFFNINIDI